MFSVCLILLRILYYNIFNSLFFFFFKDESTSAISADWVGKLYDLAKSQGITVVSIAHSKEVEKYHEKVLALKSDGGWEHGDSKE